MIDPRTTHYLELDIPEFVSDIQKEFDYINQLGTNKHVGLELLRTIIIKQDTDEYKHLSYLFEKYPFLYPHILLFSFPPGASAPIHKDGIKSDEIRFVSINIPIQGCTTNCVTEFFNIGDEFMYEPEGARSVLVIPGALEKGLKATRAGQYSLLDKPVIVDTQKPHRINNSKGLEPRVSLSWTTRFKSWDSAVEFFSKYVNP